MLVKIFSIADLLTAAVILFLHFSVLPWNIGVAAAAYMAIKFYLFRGDIASMIDLFVGVYIILLMFGVHTFLAYVFAGYLIQKGIFGLITFS